MEEETEFENSPLSQKVTRDGVTVEVVIYRGKDDPEWILEVVDQENGATVWNETFKTDQTAWDVFNKTVEDEGILTFLDDGSQAVH